MTHWPFIEFCGEKVRQRRDAALRRFDENVKRIVNGKAPDNATRAEQSAKRTVDHAEEMIRVRQDSHGG